MCNCASLRRHSCHKVHCVMCNCALAGSVPAWRQSLCCLAGKISPIGESAGPFPASTCHEQFKLSPARQPGCTSAACIANSARPLAAAASSTFSCFLTSRRVSVPVMSDTIAGPSGLMCATLLRRGVRLLHRSSGRNTGVITGST